jgi:alkyl sulfatase BDS1-like metallo-beta-lactamase superfamily hydrolase
MRQTWGQSRLSQLLTDQRDMYAYLNDQTLRLINQGYTLIGIAERLKPLHEQQVRICNGPVIPLRY